MTKKELTALEKIIIFVFLLSLLFVGYYFAVKAMVLYKTYSSSNEFVQTIDCAEIFDKNPNGSFWITFEIRASKEGTVQVYQQNGNGARYEFYEVVNVTQEYQEFRIKVSPVLVDPDRKSSYLAFYGEYGTGVIPKVRNISITACDE